MHLNKVHRYWAAVAFLLSLSLVIFGVAAQESEPTREETLYYDYVNPITNPENYNHLIPGGLRDKGYHNFMMEPLFILNYTTGEIDPWLGLSMVPNEGLDQWTLTLREGVKWQDGEEFNADDVIFTIQLLLDNAPNLSDSSSMQQWVERVEKVDDLTVLFTLLRPNPRFQLDYFSVKVSNSVIILPEHIWRDQDPTTFTFYDSEKGWPVGTGPYRVARVSERQVVYDRDDNWWGAEVGFMDLPAPRRIVLTITQTEETRAAAAIADELDRLDLLSVGSFEAAQARNPNLIAWSQELPYAWVDPCPRTLTLNNQTAPWDKANLRKAISAALDRQQIVDIAYEGANYPSETLFVQYDAMSPTVEMLIAEGLVFSATSDQDAARALIEAEGYSVNSSGIYEKDGSELSLVIQAHENILDLRQQSEVIVEQLRAVGINASLQVLAGGTWFDNIALGNYQGFVSWMPCGSINEPWATMDWGNANWFVPVGERSPNNNNLARWQNAEYSSLLDQIGVLPIGDETIPGLVLEAYRIWYDELPYVPTTQAAFVLPFNTTYWTGWPTADDPYSPPTTWWQNAHMIIHNLQPASR